MCYKLLFFVMSLIGNGNYLWRKLDGRFLTTVWLQGTGDMTHSTTAGIMRCTKIARRMSYDVFEYTHKYCYRMY